MNGQERRLLWIMMMIAPRPIVPLHNTIRLAMLGMVEGNGHPFSWSAIINGRYDKAAMRQCGYPGISAYLDAQPEGVMGIAGAEVTHVWCDDPHSARRVAEASMIEHVLENPIDAIDKVDAVLIATDKGHEHVARARPFIEAGVPVFIDKPLVDNIQDLRQFDHWVRQGRHLISTSCMRYAKEFLELKDRLHEVGQVHAITVTMANTWERYGIHAIEAVYHLLEPLGWLDVANCGTEDRNIVHARHRSGVDVVLIVSRQLYGVLGHIEVYGDKGRIHAKFQDTFHAFKSQLEAFVNYVRTGESPVLWAQTVEQMRIIIAGRLSREQQGRRVSLKDICL